MTASTCDMTRFHPFRTASAPSKSCVRVAGHEGMCRDGWGGVFAGTPSRPRALTPGEVDEYNRANDGPRPCPAHGCALLVGHTGPCMDLDAKEFAGMGTDDVDALVDALSHGLAVRWQEHEAATALNRADASFGKLDRALRDGRDLPARWADAGAPGTPTDVVYADSLYDYVSERLRATGDAGTCLRAVRVAGLNWRALVDVLDSGGPLPGPWCRDDVGTADDVLDSDDVHVSPGHEHGTMYGCGACEAHCWCGGRNEDWCVGCAD